ncbi:hypothetical protein DFH09DRAFT_1455610 [Mycena vulgaris]|nr:hypothetical protein DFH09DRAFT_1455610 [Mycena vulgaris]
MMILKSIEVKKSKLPLRSVSSALLVYCLSSDDVEEGRIQVKKVACNNLRLKLSDLVDVHPCLDIKYDKRVHMFPFDDSIEGLSGNIFDVYLKPYFLEGNAFVILAPLGSCPLLVWPIDPSARAILSIPSSTPAKGSPVKRKEEESNLANVRYGDIDSCHKQMAQIRELVELPLRHRQLFKSIGIKPPRGTLMFNPPDKTVMTRAVANKTHTFFSLINGLKIMSKMAGQSENNLQKAFEEAEKNS